MLGESSWKELCQGRTGYLLLVGVALQMLQQLVGMNALMYFGPRMFADIGMNPTLFQTLSNLVNFLATFPALLFADQYGRCSLLWWSAAGMVVACSTISSVGGRFVLANSDGTYTSTSGTASYVIVAMMFLFVINFAYGWGPIVWVYTSEMFPLRCRSQCVAATTCANWVGNFLVAQCTPVLLGHVGFLTFYIYGAFAFLALLLARWLPETRGVPLEQMDRVFDDKLGLPCKSHGPLGEALLSHLKQLEA